MSLCCDKCFDDEYLKEFVRESGEKGFCDFCKQNRRYCIDPSDLYDLFLPVVSLYKGVTNFMPLEMLKDYQGDFLWEKLQNDWEIFAHDDEINKKLLQEIGSQDSEGYYFNFDDFVLDENKYFGDDYKEEKYSKHKWRQFCFEIRHENRFFPTEKADIRQLLSKLIYREKDLKKGEVFYRGRISTKYKYSKGNMGKPLLVNAKHGRGNPGGISYLYLASDKDTALAEVKPYMGEFVTIGEFITADVIRVVDLTNPYIESPFKYGDELRDVISSIDFFKILHDELSKPLGPKETEFEYLPTQYLCEAIKKEGYGGVKFGSSLSDGYNILLFQDNKVICGRTFLYKVNAIKYKNQIINDAAEINWVEKIDDIINMLKDIVSSLESLMFWSSKLKNVDSSPSVVKGMLINLLKEMVVQLQEIQVRGYSWIKNFDVVNVLVGKILFIRKRIHELPFRKYDNQKDCSDKSYESKKKQALKGLTKIKNEMIKLRDVTKEYMGVNNSGGHDT